MQHELALELRSAENRIELLSQHLAMSRSAHLTVLLHTSIMPNPTLICRSPVYSSLAKVAQFLYRMQHVYIGYREKGQDTHLQRGNWQRCQSTALHRESGHLSLSEQPPFMALSVTAPQVYIHVHKTNSFAFHILDGSVLYIHISYIDNVFVYYTLCVLISIQLAMHTTPASHH